MARERRVVTPDGYVWFVRRRRARWRSFRSDRTARFHGEEELPAEKLPTPGLLDLFTYADDDLGERGFDRSYDDRAAARVAVSAILIVLAVAALLLWLTVWYVLPWLLPLVAADARLLLTVAGALAVVVPVLAVADHLLRPWYVELQRQGLADAPRRVWRVRGWRRSGRLLGEIAAAIQDGRIDNRRAVVLLSDGRRRGR